MAFCAIPGLIRAARDITERKQNEEDLARQGNLLRTLIDTLPDFIYVKDTASRFLAANIAMAHSLGVNDPAELVGKTDFDYSQPDLAEAYFAEEQQVMRTGKAVHNRETYGVDHNGDANWTMATRVPLTNNDGAIIGLVGINRDITERRQMEETLRQSEEQYRTLFDQSINALLLCEAVVDEQGTPTDFVLLQTNRAFEDSVKRALARYLRPTFDARVPRHEGHPVVRRDGPRRSNPTTRSA